MGMEKLYFWKASRNIILCTGYIQEIPNLNDKLLDADFSECPWWAAPNQSTFVVATCYFTC